MKYRCYIIFLIIFACSSSSKKIIENAKVESEKILKMELAEWNRKNNAPRDAVFDASLLSMYSYNEIEKTDLVVVVFQYLGDSPPTYCSFLLNNNGDILLKISSWDDSEIKKAAFIEFKKSDWFGMEGKKNNRNELEIWRILFYPNWNFKILSEQNDTFRFVLQTKCGSALYFEYHSEVNSFPIVVDENIEKDCFDN